VLDFEDEGFLTVMGGVFEDKRRSQLEKRRRKEK
jgi:hypothetical protein